jgi:hypothetical protein
VATLNMPGHQIEVGRIALNTNRKTFSGGRCVAAKSSAAFDKRCRNARLACKRQKAEIPIGQQPHAAAGEANASVRFKIASVLLTDGAISLVGAPGEKDVAVGVDHLNLRAENITNSTALAPT